MESVPRTRSPFYTLPTGSRSCYNHVVMAGLQAFIEAGGEADLEVYRKVLRWVMESTMATARTTFGEGTEWQEALAKRKSVYTPAKRKDKW